MDTYTVSGNIVDIIGGNIFQGTVTVDRGTVVSLKEESTRQQHFIIPGLVDAHVHVESSMLVPSEFARLAVTHGTVAAVCDPHEIANVLGLDGVRFMIDNGAMVPFKFFFGAPSCVPATDFESTGARIELDDLHTLLAMDEIGFLSEMMNFPGVLNRDTEVMAKIALARKLSLPIDGHAPGLTGEDAARYAAAGISTDHECSDIQEALDKIQAGMHILIREGSAARNFDSLVDLLGEYPEKTMFCSDDKHPDELADGHMDQLLQKAVARGYDPITVLRSCVLNPVRHYNMDVGLLQPGDPADYIIVDDLEGFAVKETRINGVKVAENRNSLIEPVAIQPRNVFKADLVAPVNIRVQPGRGRMRVIQAQDGELLTGSETVVPLCVDGWVVSDTSRDILKIVALNRYEAAAPAIGFVSGFGLQHGAIASTVAHDSHNILAVGVDDADIVQAVNLLVSSRGGISFAAGNFELTLPLPVAGRMADRDGYSVASRYRELDRAAKQAGATLTAPYMTLSFMALLVIPSLKISDQGVFDSNTFAYTPLFGEENEPGR